MKKIIALALCLLFALSFAACGGNNDVTEPSGDTQTAAVDLAVVLDAIKTGTALEGTQAVSADSLYDVYGIESTQYKQAACCIVPTGVFPAEVLMFEAVDADALAAISAKLELRLQEVKNQSQSYDAENYALAQKCAVKTEGNFIALFISADSEQMNTILFETYVK